MDLTQYIICTYDVYVCMCVYVKPKFHKTISFLCVIYSDIVFSILSFGKKSL